MCLEYIDLIVTHNFIFPQMFTGFFILCGEVNFSKLSIFQVKQQLDLNDCDSAMERLAVIVVIDIITGS